MKKQCILLLLLLPFFLSAQLESGFYGSDYVSGYELNSKTESFEKIGGESQINVFKIESDYIVWGKDGQDDLYYTYEFVEDREYDGVSCGIYSIKDKNNKDKEIMKFLVAYSENKFYWYLNFNHSKDTYTTLMLFENVEQIGDTDN